MSDIKAWLEGIGLGKYIETFAENEIDIEVLPHLTEEDIQALGLPLGPRRKLLTAIAALKGKSDSVSKDDREPSAPTATPEPPPTPQAERRQLTVMFVDLVGSTALSSRLDPEDLRELILAYQNVVAGEITRFEGYIARYMGDGVLAYFGWPRAHEDEAERAVRASLAVTAAVAKLTAPAGKALVTRIGIATGLVVVGDLIGDGAAQEQAVVGETPNLAARLQGLAAPGTVVISAGTRRLLGELFELQALGPQVLKGIAGPVDAYTVLRERPVESRYQAQRAGAVLPLIGREHELAQLMECWQQAKSGEGRVILLKGEAGIGKSRLLRALDDAITGQAHHRINYQCSPYHTDSALYPAIQYLTRAAAFAVGDDDETRLDKLEALLGQALDKPTERAPLIAALLGIDSKKRYGPLELTPQQQRTQTLQTLLAHLSGLAQSQSVLFVLEDAHWIDPTTLEFIEQSLDVVRRSRVLLLITARLMFKHEFGGHPSVTGLTLNRLGREPSSAIIQRLSGGKTLPAELLAEILRKTDGVPLFVEELTKTVLESGLLRETEERYVLQGPLESLDIPSSLHDSLMARLDRLQPIREVAQIASCIGREFSYGLLAAVAQYDEQALQAALAQLVEAGLVFQSGQPPQASYTFKHALVQDAAYTSLLLSRRRQLHARIAEALQEQLPKLAEDQPELVAHHCTEAGLAIQATRFWQLAGTRAAERAAYTEAIGDFSKGLDQVSAIEDKAKQLSATVKLNLGLAGSMRIVERLDDALQALERAESAAKQSASAIDLAEVCYLRGNLYFPMGRIDDCLAQHERSRNYAREAGAPELEARALGGLGDAYYMSGRMITAAQHFGRCITLSRDHGDQRTAAAYGVMYGATRYYQNECEAALHEVIASAEGAAQNGQPRAEMIARGVIGLISMDMGKRNEAREALETAIAYSRRLAARRFEALYLAQLSEFPGFAGRRDEACAMLEQAYAIARETSITFVGPWILGKLARQTDAREVRQRALQEGEELLRQGCVSHCYFHFYRDAIETALMTADWDNAERYATALEAYTSAEPLPWSDFFIARGRALAAHGRNSRSSTIQQELRRLRDEALRVGLLAAVPALDQALE